MLPYGEVIIYYLTNISSEGVELGKRLFREFEKLVKTAVDSSLNHHINKYKSDVKKAEKRIMGLKRPYRSYLERWGETSS